MGAFLSLRLLRWTGYRIKYWKWLFWRLLAMVRKQEDWLMCKQLWVRVIYGWHHDLVFCFFCHCRWRCITLETTLVKVYTATKQYGLNALWRFCFCVVFLHCAKLKTYSSREKEGPFFRPGNRLNLNAALFEENILMIIFFTVRQVPSVSTVALFLRNSDLGLMLCEIREYFVDIAIHSTWVRSCSVIDESWSDQISQELGKSQINWRWTIAFPSKTLQRYMLSPLLRYHRVSK